MFHAFCLNISSGMSSLGFFLSPLGHESDSRRLRVLDGTYAEEADVARKKRKVQRDD